jgi:hypothetical protein
MDNLNIASNTACCLPRLLFSAPNSMGKASNDMNLNANADENGSSANLELENDTTLNPPRMLRDACESLNDNNLHLSCCERIPSSLFFKRMARPN